MARRAAPLAILRRLLRALPLLAALLALAACSPIAALNGLAAHGAGHRVTPGVAYGPLPRQQLDVYTPAGAPPPGGWPMVVFFYGGSWSSGERADYAFVGAALAGRGIATLVADYRLHPQVRYPAFLQDSARALAWGLGEARRLGADPRRVYVMGHSAGGYNAAMLALDPRWLAETGHAPTELAGWIGLAGPYDFFPTEDPALRTIFHAPDYPPRSQPIELALRGTPRAFLGAPPDDRVVSYVRSTEQLHSLLAASGVPVELHRYPRANHQTLIGSFAWPLRWAGPVLDDVVRFVEAEPAAR